MVQVAQPQNNKVGQQCVNAASCTSGSYCCEGIVFFGPLGPFLLHRSVGFPSSALVSWSAARYRPQRRSPMTTSNQVTLEAEIRRSLGHRNRALRRAGITPLHLYGQGEASLALQAGAHDVSVSLAKAGRTTPITVNVDADEYFVMVREIQRHPVTDQLLHVDLIRISRTEKLRVRVPVHVEGEAPAARVEGMALSHDLHEVEVEALPLEIPNVFTVDVSGMDEVDSVIRVSALLVPANVDIVTEPDTPVARIVTQRLVAETSGEDAGGPPEGGAVPVTGDAPETATPGQRDEE